MRASCAVAAVFGALSVTCFAQPATAAGALEAKVLDEVNFARTRPAEYAKVLRQRAPEMIGEDPRDVAEAIQFLSRQKPLPPLSPDSKLAQAARAHATAQGRAGEVGHTSPGGVTFGKRLQIHGIKVGMAAENISYGYDDPRAVVRQLIVDTGVPDRGHRRNIFTEGHEAAGVSCAPHKEWGSLCVIDFAGQPLGR
ncbi:CAP domain-containing protein [Phenylobacterium sp.]|jgi:hypothetical protein|uniref:CAP domain-containing protein n=1 Tax=Phenylobacterium sp. TaxID=1871053 RepID=UPI002F94E6E2